MAGPADSGDTDGGRPWQADDLAEVDLRDRSYGIYECATCDNVVLSVQTHDGMTCHGERMEPVTDWDLSVEPPDLREVLLEVFALPKPGLDICLCVIGDGPLPPEEVADRLGYDASTVRRYLNRLVEMGLLERSQLNREDGGFVNVYHSIDLSEMRRETLVGFYVWAGEAASLIERANLTKEDYIDEGAGDDGGLEEVFWERFEGGS